MNIQAVTGQYYSINKQAATRADDTANTAERLQDWVTNVLSYTSILSGKNDFVFRYFYSSRCSWSESGTYIARQKSRAKGVRVELNYENRTDSIFLRVYDTHM